MMHDTDIGLLGLLMLVRPLVLLALMAGGVYAACARLGLAASSAPTRARPEASSSTGSQPVR